MERDFWLARWKTGEIGFHQADADPMLQRYWPELSAPAGATVFVPLCGKSLDMRFLERAGHPVLGIELAEAAVEAYFAEGGEEPTVASWTGGRVYRAGETAIYVGDYFALDAEALAGVGAVYDRAAIVALPPPMRERYAAHARRVLPGGIPSLVISIEYDQSAVAGPPFSVAEDELVRLYGADAVEQLDERPAAVMPPKFAGIEVVARVHRIRIEPPAPG